jgi:dimethylamine/trimethylamine dehydrogenase
MGEEWRRGWHSENIAEKKSESSVLVVGAGPSGLECARALGQRGYTVTLAEGTTELGGRVSNESRLPGLSEWGRVRDYREGQIAKMVNVETYMDSQLTADQVLEFEADYVVLATGSYWRKDGVGRANHRPIDGADGDHVYSPDDLISGTKLSGRVIIFDDDHYYMGGVLAEKLIKEGYQVALVTPAADASTWTHNTMEQFRIQSKLLDMGVVIVPHRNVVSVKRDHVELACVYTDRIEKRDCDSIVMVTSRLPRDELYHELMEKIEGSTIKSVTRIGDCLAPGTIAAAVYSGHRYAREMDEPVSEGVPFRRELPQLAED